MGKRVFVGSWPCLVGLIGCVGSRPPLEYHELATPFDVTVQLEARTAYVSFMLGWLGETSRRDEVERLVESRREAIRAACTLVLQAQSAATYQSPEALQCLRDGLALAVADSTAQPDVDFDVLWRRILVQ